MWANLHLLFWLSLFPFVTGWMGENHFAPLPTAMYGAVLMLAAMAYYILQGRILATHGKGSKLAADFGKDWKGKLSVIAYAFALLLVFFNAWIANAIYIVIAIIWLVPDRRIERTVID